MTLAELLDVPKIRERAVPLTVEQYHALYEQGLIVENVELLEGLIVEKMPKSPLHSTLLTRLMRILLAVAGEKFSVRPQQPITCKRSEPEPDLALVTASPNDYVTGHPKTAEIAIEIATSSVEIDRHKTAIYAEAGVREYWIVLPKIRHVEVHTNLTRSRYAVQRIFTEGQTAFSEVLPAFRVELSALFPR